MSSTITSNRLKEAIWDTYKLFCITYVTCNIVLYAIIGVYYLGKDSVKHSQLTKPTPAFRANPTYFTN